MSLLTFHTFDKTGEKQCDVNLPTEVASDIYDMLEELKNMIVHEPKSDETKALKNEFVEILYVNGLIPAGLSKDYVLSLLNPSWLNNKQKTSNTKTVSPLLKSFKSSISERISYFLQNFKNFFGKTILKNTVKSPLNTVTAEASFCSISSGGNGVTLPLFLLPRPRVLAFWTASSAVTMVGELLSSPVGKGFVAEGAQSGSMLGFTGLGITYAFPGYIVYGFVGYALYAKVSADSIEYYPLNNEPVISDENPTSGSENILVSLSELSFRISDLDGDLMDYTVTTDPNIGSGSANNQNDGAYTVQISGLDYDKSYSWTVSVTDGKDLVEKEFGFVTESRPFDPFDEGWQYKKKITIDHTKVVGDLNYFPVLISVTDNDLRDKAQDDGDDILFMDGAGVANKLCHEIESFDGSSGKLVAWVRIPNLESNTDTVFYMYYGNNDCSNQESGFKVWDSYYIMVQHINEGGTGLRYDSTINNNDGTPVGYEGDEGTTGIADGADHLDGVDDYINFGDVDTNIYTCTVWIKPDTTITKNTVVKSLWDHGSSNDYICALGDSTSLLTDETICLHRGAGDYRTGVINVDISNTDFHMITYTWRADLGRYDIYFDGRKQDVVPGGHGHVPLMSSPATLLGHEYGTGAYYLNGIVDEASISSIERSAEWIKTEYNTMIDPSSFFSVGPEETGF
jgi:hypothetical protein